MIGVIVVYSVINVVIQSVIQPRYVGDAVGLSPTITLLSLIFWAWALGAIGALLAVPFSLFMRAILVEADPTTHWVLPILSGHLAKEPPGPPGPRGAGHHRAGLSRRGPSTGPPRHRRRGPRREVDAGHDRADDGGTQGPGQGSTRARHRWSRTPRSARMPGATRSAWSSARPRPACPSSCRSGTAGCWSPRSPSTAAPRCRWRPTCRRCRRPACGCSCAVTRTCRTSGCSPRPTAGSSSTSTTSTRRCPGRSSGTSSGSPPAWPSPAATSGWTPKDRKTLVLHGVGAYRKSMAEFAEKKMLEVWYARLDVEDGLDKLGARGRRRRPWAAPARRWPRRARATACRCSRS